MDWAIVLRADLGKRETKGRGYRRHCFALKFHPQSICKVHLGATEATGSYRKTLESSLSGQTDPQGEWAQYVIWNDLLSLQCSPSLLCSPMHHCSEALNTECYLRLLGTSEYLSSLCILKFLMHSHWTTLRLNREGQSLLPLPARSPNLSI